MYSLRVLFFSLPLYFSHVFSPLGLTIGESYSFERYKVYFFLILLFIACIEGLIRYPCRIWDIVRKYAHTIALLLVIPIVSALYFNGSIDMAWLLGSYEKHHGYLFYSSILWLILLLIASPREQLRQYISWSTASAILVALIALGEHMGGIFDIYGRSDMLSMYPGRSSSTLGNPNYVAGYLLLFIPLLAWIRSPERWIVLGLLSLAIVTTGSYIAIALLGLYLLYSLLRYVGISAVISLVGVLVFALVGSYIGSLYLDSEKILSLTSRFVLMRESISMMLREPISFLIGFGPDSIVSHFTTARSLIVDAYFPPTGLIDSSHNVFLDILFQYGILPLTLLGYTLVSHWKNQKEELQTAILLGGAFLALNVFVLVHLMVLGLIVIISADYRGPRKKSI